MLVCLTVVLLFEIIFIRELIDLELAVAIEEHHRFLRSLGLWTRVLEHLIQLVMPV
jgi:hypothetical protein